MELRVVLLTRLNLKPDIFRPPRSSWKRLKAGTTPVALGVRLEALVEALGLPAVQQIARKCPHILNMTVPTLLSKLEELTPLLRLDRGRLVALVSAYPALLGASPATVHRRFTLLVVELRRDEPFVADMVAGQPVLLGMAEDTLRQRVGLLHEAASLLPATWGRQLDTMSPSMLGRLLKASEYVLLRLLYTYMRTHNNGRNYAAIRSMATIVCRPNAAWQREQPGFHDWVMAGERDRDAGFIRPWKGWLREPF